ncbi:uncharacterized protein PG986_011364 [Apiospora aurea]|uniref:Uncharacterized protein n=1 Tax=Apiospora aurea TaxID=335848 RepID=A0ABR1Q4U5_9PEZI
MEKAQVDDARIQQGFFPPSDQDIQLDFHQLLSGIDQVCLALASDGDNSVPLPSVWDRQSPVAPLIQRASTASQESWMTLMCTQPPVRVDTLRCLIAASVLVNVFEHGDLGLLSGSCYLLAKYRKTVLQRVYELQAHESDESSTQAHQVTMSPIRTMFQKIFANALRLKALLLQTGQRYRADFVPTGARFNPDTMSLIGLESMEFWQRNQGLAGRGPTRQTRRVLSDFASSRPSMRIPEKQNGRQTLMHRRLPWTTATLFWLAGSYLSFPTIDTVENIAFDVFRWATKSGVWLFMVISATSSAVRAMIGTLAML